MNLAAKIAQEGKQDRELSAALRTYADSTAGNGGAALYDLYAAEYDRGVERSWALGRENAGPLADLVDAHGALVAYRLCRAASC
jgi:hypothetical protein